MSPFILKKGDKTLCENYRGSFLVDGVYNILIKMIRDGIRYRWNEVSNQERFTSGEEETG